MALSSASHPNQTHPNQTLPAGSKAPHFQLRAVGSHRIIAPGDTGGAALLLAFHDQHAVEQIREMQLAVRARIPAANRLLVASVVNMSAVPRLLRGAAESVMQGSYAKAAGAMPKGLNAADYVIILPDWDGKVSHAFGAHGTDRKPLMTLIDDGGLLRSRYQGKELIQAALEMVGGLG